MDEPQPARDPGEGEEAELPVPAEHHGGVHEARRHHLGLHAQALPRPRRRAVPGIGPQQKIRTGERLREYLTIFIDFL